MKKTLDSNHGNLFKQRFLNKPAISSPFTRIIKIPNQRGFFLLMLFVMNIQLVVSQINSELDSLLNRGKFHAVVKKIDSIENQTNTQFNYAFYRGKANEGAMRYNDAYTSYKKWYASDTTNLDAKLAMARMANLSGRTQEAKTLFEEMTQMDSLSFSLNYQLGRIYQQNNSLNKAILTYQRILPVDSTNISLLNNLADCYNSLGLFPGAIVYYEKAFEQNPYDANIAIKEANVIIEFQKNISDSIAGARRIIDKALQYSPQSIPLRQSKAILKFMDRQYEECDSLLTTIIAEGDSSKMNFKYQGLSRVYRRRYFDALFPLAIADSLFRDQNGNRTDTEVALKYPEVLGRCGDRRLSLNNLAEYEEQLNPQPSILSQINFIRGMVYNYEQQRSKAKNAYWKSYSLNPTVKSLSNYTNLFYDIVDKERKSKMTPNELQQALFAHIYFLKMVPDKEPQNTNSMHSVSRKILYYELEEMFMRGDSELTLKDPNGKKFTFSQAELKNMITAPQ
ncbi:MAG: hypothetical protein RR202_01990 [Bacteroidales bacterium]